MTEDGTTAEVCVHRWSLSAPVGEETQGVCSRCGASRSFSGANKSRPASAWRKRPGPTDTPAP